MYSDAPQLSRDLLRDWYRVCREPSSSVSTPSLGNPPSLGSRELSSASATPLSLISVSSDLLQHLMGQRPLVWLLSPALVLRGHGSLSTSQATGTRTEHIIGMHSFGILFFLRYIHSSIYTQGKEKTVNYFLSGFQ